MKRVLLVCPTAWDERQRDTLAPAVRAAYELVLDSPRDDEILWDFDVEAHVARRAREQRGRLAGVMSSSDYPGAVAAALLARALALPGPAPAAVLRAGHKHHARLVQRSLAPEAVPRFALVDPERRASWPRAFPCFVKPVRGSFSLLARRVDDAHELERLLTGPAAGEHRRRYVRMAETLAATHAPELADAGAFLAEELLSGQQVTVEGWVQGGAAHVLGIVDTSFHPGTTSFASFDYPSRLAPAVQARLGELAGRVALALGLDETPFNVELFYDAERERAALVELNPRLCGQFADLYHKVDGTHGYEVALALACGEEPRVRRGAGAFAAAASVPLRVFASSVLARAPGRDELAELERRFPGSLAWIECASGTFLEVGPEIEDGHSVRFGVLNLGGRDRDELAEKAVLLRENMGIELVAAAAP